MSLSGAMVSSVIRAGERHVMVSVSESNSASTSVENLVFSNFTVIALLGKNQLPAAWTREDRERRERRNRAREERESRG